MCLCFRIGKIRYSHDTTQISVGIGYADLENRLPCRPETVFRIASISKSITMAIVAKLWENGDLDLDKPIQSYVPSFPEKTFDNEKVRTLQQGSNLCFNSNAFRKSCLKKKKAC